MVGVKKDKSQGNYELMAKKSESIDLMDRQQLLNYFFSLKEVFVCQRENQKKIEECDYYINNEFDDSKKEENLIVTFVGAFLVGEFVIPFCVTACASLLYFPVKFVMIIVDFFIKGASSLYSGVFSFLKYMPYIIYGMAKGDISVKIFFGEFTLSSYYFEKFVAHLVDLPLIKSIIVSLLGLFLSFCIISIPFIVIIALIEVFKEEKSNRLIHKEKTIFNKKKEESRVERNRLLLSKEQNDKTINLLRSIYSKKDPEGKLFNLESVQLYIEELSRETNLKFEDIVSNVFVRRKLQIIDLELKELEELKNQTVQNQYIIEM